MLWLIHLYTLSCTFIMEFLHLDPNTEDISGGKKYLTTFQMTQFVVVVGHMLNIAIRFPNCTYPTAFKIIIACYGVLFYYLFAGFFKSAYGKSTPTQKTNGVSNGTKKLE